MSSVASDVINNIVQTLVGSGAFASVSLGEGSSMSGVPRAAVIYEGQEVLSPDDCSSGQWVRLLMRVRIHTRTPDEAQAAARACELYDLAAALLGEDPSRGGMCQDLPVGRATETGRNVLEKIKRPEVELSFPVRCHFES